MQAHITYVVTTTKSSGVCKQSLASFQYNLKKNIGKVWALYAKKSDGVVHLKLVVVVCCCGLIMTIYGEYEITWRLINY
jgi:hypothetical protein